MALVYPPSAPYPPSQAVFVHAKLSTTTFQNPSQAIPENEVHKLTAMPHCTAFYYRRNVNTLRDSAMPVSACGTQSIPQLREIQPLGVVCDPVLDGVGVYRHPDQLGSIGCGIRGMFTLTVSDYDLRNAAIGDNLYIATLNQNDQSNVAGSMSGYKLLRYNVRQSLDHTDTPDVGQPKIIPDKLIGRIVGFGKNNEVTVILA